MATILAVCGRGIDHGVVAYLNHCRRMDAWERRRRLARDRRRRERWLRHWLS